MKYSILTVEPDFVTHKPHLFYLMGYCEEENCAYIIASYSIKTDRMILKDCSNYIPMGEHLIQFISIAKKRYEKEN